MNAYKIRSIVNQALPVRFLLVLGAIIALDVIAAEGVKHVFYQRVKF